MSKLPFKDVDVLRPFLVQPLHGITSRTGWYRAFDAAFAPFAPIWKAVLPGYVTTTERVGKAMLILVRRGAPKRLLETGDINRLVREPPSHDPDILRGGYRKTAIHWVVSAKRDETRAKRLATLIKDSAAGLRIAQLRRPNSK